MTVALPEHHVIHRRGCPIHFWTSGQPNRPAVVLTHGFTMDHRIFVAQERELAQRFRVISWDVPGHGLSSPLGTDFTVHTAAVDLISILDVLGIEKAAFVGHSMGGYIAQELDFRWPERVTALAMLSTTCLTFRQPMVMKLGGPLTTAALKLWPEPWVHRHIGMIAGLRAETRDAAQRASRTVRRDDRHRIWEAILSCYHEEPSYRCSAPLLVMNGSYDFVVGFGLIKLLTPRWLSHVPAARWVQVPNAGHNLMQDNPEYCTQELVRFLGGL